MRTVRIPNAVRLLASAIFVALAIFGLQVPGLRAVVTNVASRVLGQPDFLHKAPNSVDPPG